MATDKPHTVNESDDMIERKKAGKLGNLWRVEITYHVDSEVRLHRIGDMYDREMRVFREAIFKAGLMIWIDPGHYYVVPPFDLNGVHCYRQNCFFGDDHSIYHQLR